MVVMAGPDSGTMICRKICNSPAPSTLAAANDVVGYCHNELASEKDALPGESERKNGSEAIE